MTVQETIDAALALEQSSRSYEQTSFHVGSLSGCLRGAYLARKGEHTAIPMDPRKLRVFAMGSMVEKFVEDCLQKQGVILETQGRLEWPELGLSGRFDFLVKDAERGVIVAECKSVHSNSFHWNKKRGGKPSDHKLMQVSMYHNKLKERFPQLAASVVDVSKDDLMVNEYVLTADDIATYSAMGLANAKVLHDCWESGELPPLPPTIVEEYGKYKTNWQAAYCPLHHICLGDFEWQDKAAAEVKRLNAETKAN